MIYERIDELCKENKTSITALCIETTGSSGNLKTWKKDNIRLNCLISICKKFKVSADFVLGIEEPLIAQSLELETQDHLRNTDEQNFLQLFRQLSTKDKEELKELIEFKLERAKKENNKNARSSTLTDSLTG